MTLRSQQFALFDAVAVATATGPSSVIDARSTIAAIGRDCDPRETIAVARPTDQRLGVLAHEMRNLLETAMLAVAAIKRSEAAGASAAGAALDRSLLGMRDLVDRSLADARRAAASQSYRKLVVVADVVAEIRSAGLLMAQSRGRTLSVVNDDESLTVYADRTMLHCALMNLLQNALKFSRLAGHVSIRVRRTVGNRISIDVEDECGGLAQGAAEVLFRPFEQHSADRSGLGLGLDIARRNIEDIGGTVEVRNRPGVGCVFTVALPAGATGPTPRDCARSSERHSAADQVAVASGSSRSNSFLTTS